MISITQSLLGENIRDTLGLNLGGKYKNRYKTCVHFSSASVLGVCIAVKAVDFFI